MLTEETEYLAEAVTFAAPTFLAPYLIEGAGPVRDFVYSPWLTANLTLDRWPGERRSDRAGYVREVLAQGIAFDAVVSANDQMAVSILEALRDAKVRVPEDVSVTGFDDILSAGRLSLPLTTVRQPTFELARRAMQVLLGMLKGEQPVIYGDGGQIRAAQKPHEKGNRQKRYQRCTDCHSQIHGSDTPSAGGKGRFTQ